MTCSGAQMPTCCDLLRTMRWPRSQGSQSAGELPILTPFFCHTSNPSPPFQGNISSQNSSAPQQCLKSLINWLKFLTIINHKIYTLLKTQKVKTFGQHVVWSLVTKFSSPGCDGCLTLSCCRQVMKGPPSRPWKNTTSAFIGNLQCTETDQLWWHIQRLIETGIYIYIEQQSVEWCIIY